MTASENATESPRPSAPRLWLHFEPIREGARAFTPLAPSRRVVPRLEDIEPTALERGHLQFRASLEAGRLELPLFEGRDFPVEVPEDCELRGWWTAGPGPMGEPEVQSFELVFDPPVLLYEVLPVLARLHTLFEDRRVSAFLARVDALRRSELARRGRLRLEGAWRRLRPWLRERLGEGELPLGARPGQLRELAELLEAGAQVPRVELRRAAAHPQPGPGGEELVFRFSGRVLLGNLPPFPFEDVRLPALLLPYLRAELRHLLGPEPLATASLRGGTRAEALGRAAAGRLREVEGRFYFLGVSPGLGLDLLLGNHDRLELELDSPGKLRLQGRFQGTLGRERADFRLEGLELRGEGTALGLDLGLELEQREGGGSLAELLLLAALEGRWPELGLRSSLVLAEDSHLGEFHLRLMHGHPLLRGGTRLEARLQDLRVSGRARTAWELSSAAGEDPGNPFEEVDISFSTEYRVEPGSGWSDGRSRLGIRELDGRAEGRVLAAGGALRLEVDGPARFAGEAELPVAAFPELGVEEGPLRAGVGGEAELHGRVAVREESEGRYALDFRETALRLLVERAGVEQGCRELALPPGSRFEAGVPDAFLSTTGLGQAKFDVSWDLGGRSPVLRRGEREVELFVPELRQGALTVGLGPTGRITLSGPEGGLYDAHYFNALLNPVEEWERWLAILRDEEAVGRVLAAAELFTGELARDLRALRDFAERVQGILDEEGIEQPGDLVPAPVIARLLARILLDDERQGEVPALAARILPLVQQVVEARGLDLRATRRLLEDVLPERVLADWSLEIDRGLAILGRLLAPMEPLPPMTPRELPALVEQRRWRERFADIPSAAELYRRLLDPEPLDAEFTGRVARIAPYLSLEQLDWIAGLGREDWPELDRLRLEHVHDLKRRVRQIAEGYGGFGFAPQARAISFFLGVAIDLADRTAPREELDPLVSDVFLGPEEIAVLLQAGLAAPLHGRVVQVNQRMLLDLVLSESPDFLQAVLVELGEGGPRVLAGVLNALLELEQGAMREPLDVVAAFSERLGIELPRLSDFLAGGRRARESYYEALNRAAEEILAPERAEPYLALRAWVRVARHEPPRAYLPRPSSAPLEEAARRAIAEADRLGGLCTFRSAEPARRQRAREAYERAFAACRELLREEPLALELPWLHAFYARNHEALIVRSVVRNVQGDVDEVRKWLRARTGRAIPRSEQRLVDAVIDALYFEEEDRRALKADPLVRLLVDPPPGPYRFTIVSCMGVITEGERGKELEEAYRRITEQYGVRVIRANTANVRSLEFNAARVEEAVRRVEGPWGYVGYSQGCANGLMAEARMFGGTPEQQALLEGLCCRNFLFSAINGSPHGTYGDLKFLEVLVMADRFLSLYQATLSQQAIQLALRGIRSLLDAPFFILGLRGARSVAYEGVIPLARDGQWKRGIPSVCTRGIVAPETLPEVLELLSNSLTVQVQSDRHDTQVLVDEAVGHPVWVKNAETAALERLDAVGRVQATHHWSPLYETVDFITTERDRERAIYDYPKDRHIFPWVELNARFGFIPAGDSQDEIGA